jgi:stage V sporulation protein SpoVS
MKRKKSNEPIVTLLATGAKEHGRANDLGAAVAGAIEVGQMVHIQAIGPFAVNNAIKAVAIAEQMINLIEKNVELAVRPAYLHKRIRGNDVVVIDLHCMRVDGLPQEDERRDLY